MAGATQEPQKRETAGSPVALYPALPPAWASDSLSLKQLRWIRRVVSGATYLDALGTKPVTHRSRTNLAISYLENPVMRSRLVRELMLCGKETEAVRLLAWPAVMTLGSTFEAGNASTGAQRQGTTAVRMLASLGIIKAPSRRDAGPEIPAIESRADDAIEDD